jgi:hypothetical protein
MAPDMSHPRSYTRPPSRRAGPVSWLLACCAASVLAPGCAQLLGIDELESKGDAGVAPQPDARPADAGPSDTTGPGIASVSPIPDGVNVAPDAVLTVTFDEAVNPDSVAAGVELRGPDDSPVPGTVEVQDNVATLKPAADLALLGTHTAIVGTAVSDLAGNALTLGTQWTFQVRDGAWGASDLIENNNAARSFRQRVAMDDRGNAIAVWDQNTTVWTNRYDVDTGWGTSALLEPNMLGDARDAQVAMDAQGNALAIWTQLNGGRREIMTRRYDVAAGDWGPAAPIGNLGLGDVSEPQLAMNRDGKGVAVWAQVDDDTTFTSLWASSYQPADGWSTPRLIENDSTASAINPRVAMSPSGSAMAVWTEVGTTRNRVWANFNVAGTSWLVPEELQPFDTSSAAQPHVAIDAAGNAVAVWQVGTETRASRYTQAGWDEHVVIMSSTEGPPYVALDPAGNAVAAARHTVTSGRPGRMVAARYGAGASAWEKSVVIGVIDINAAAAPPVVGMDPLGNAIVAWDFHDADPIMLVAARYTVGSGWAPDEELDTPRSGQDPQIAINRQGKAWLTWGSRNSDFRRDINATPFR